jgi:protein-S-isoprenylcysteine O-methyltransferase Ste14
MAISIIEKLRIPLSRLLVTALIILIFCSESKWEETILGAILFASGCFLVAVAAIGRLWCSVYIAGYKTNVLITKGPYSICRHPLYFFSFLGAVGLGLATESFVILFIIFSAFVTYYPSVIKSEEADLLNRHGDAYKIYRSATPVFFPHLSLLQEPDTAMVHTRIFRKHSLDGLWFMWLVGIIESFEAFQKLGILPVFFNLH